jgi:uncharacterized membrane protein
VARADAAVRRRARPAPLTVPRWLPTTSLIIAALGLAVAAYLTYEHYTASSTLACSDNGLVNCLKVTTSAQSKVFGIPVALLGLLYFVAMVPLCLPATWRNPAPAIRYTRLGACVAGVGFVIYLLYAELFTIGNICLWCTAVHVLTLALFGVILFGGAALEPAHRPPDRE